MRPFSLSSNLTNNTGQEGLWGKLRIDDLHIRLVNIFFLVVCVWILDYNTTVLSSWQIFPRNSLIKLLLMKKVHFPLIYLTHSSLLKATLSRSFRFVASEVLDLLWFPSVIFSMMRSFKRQMWKKSPRLNLSRKKGHTCTNEHTQTLKNTPQRQVRLQWGN